MTKTQRRSVITAIWDCIWIQAYVKSVLNNVWNVNLCLNAHNVIWDSSSILPPIHAYHVTVHAEHVRLPLQFVSRVEMKIICQEHNV